MRILVIANSIGKTAPGIVFERIVQGLASFHEVDLLVTDNQSSVDLSKVNAITIIKGYSLRSRIVKLFISLLGVNPFDLLWGMKARRKIETGQKYDIVFSFMSFGHYESIMAGFMISKKIKAKFAVYSVDAIPAPTGWMPYDSYYRGLEKMIKKHLSKPDAFFSSNPQMLAYQLDMISSRKEMFTSVIFTPGQDTFKVLPFVQTGEDVFLYTGGIYGARKSDYVLEGFAKLLKKFPESRLVFVGSVLPQSTLNKFEKDVIARIDILPFVQDLLPYYSKATALLDIDADLENDIFLSSKVMNYIMMDRIIITETGINSPSRKLLKNIDSIIQCSHDGNEIFEAMEKAILTKNTVSFENRFPVVELFKLENVIAELNKDLNKVVAA